MGGGNVLVAHPITSHPVTKAQCMTLSREPGRSGSILIKTSMWHEERGQPQLSSSKQAFLSEEGRSKNPGEGTWAPCVLLVRRSQGCAPQVFNQTVRSFYRWGKWGLENPGGGGLVAKSRPTLVTPWTVWSPPGFSVHGNFSSKNTGVGSHFLLRGIFLTQGWNQGLLHCRRILYWLSQQGSPGIYLIHIV